MDLASDLLTCLTVAAICAWLANRVRLPLPLLQCLAGALLAWPLGVDLPLDPHAFLLLLVPPLLFLDGWRIPKRELAQARSTILLMAFGLVVVTVLGVGLLIAWWVPAIPATVAFAIAATLSPTDAVAVAGLTGRHAVPPRLMTILQGEALLNDASGLVSLRVAVAATVTGTFSWLHAARSFALVAIGGTAVGVVLAWLFARLLRLLGRAEGDEPGARILLIMMFPYAAYVVAEDVHLSGILAAATAGMVANRFDLMGTGQRAVRLQGMAMLHMIEVALNGLVFVLLGLQLPGILSGASAIAREARLSTASLALHVALVVLGLFTIRLIWVWVSMRVTIFRARARGVVHHLSIRLVVASALAGVRGAVTLAAVLTLPLTLDDGSPFPAREVAVFFATGAIVLWLIAASIGLPRLLAGVELPADGDALDESTRVRALLAEAAIAAVQAADADPEVTELVLGRYRARLLGDAATGGVDLQAERSLRAIALRAERDRLVALARAHEVSEATSRALLRELDLFEEAVEPAAPSR